MKSPPIPEDFVESRQRFGVGRAAKGKSPASFSGQHKPESNTELLIDGWGFCLAMLPFHQHWRTGWRISISSVFPPQNILNN